MIACTFLMPETSCACRTALTTPRWLHEVRMINPRSLRLKAVAISWLNWSGS